MTIYHKHHIVPKHAGGADEPSNIVLLTIEEHAEAHKILFEKYGRPEDKLAWLGLAGLIGKNEILKEKMVLAGLKRRGIKFSEKTKYNMKRSWENRMSPKNTIQKIKLATTTGLKIQKII